MQHHGADGMEFDKFIKPYVVWLAAFVALVAGIYVAAFVP